MIGWFGSGKLSGNPPSAQLTVKGSLVPNATTLGLTFPSFDKQGSISGWNAIAIDGKVFVKALPLLTGLGIEVQRTPDQAELALSSPLGRAKVSLSGAAAATARSCAATVSSPSYGSVAKGWVACSPSGERRARSVRTTSWTVDGKSRWPESHNRIAIEELSTGWLTALLRSDDSAHLKALAWQADGCSLVANFHYADHHGGGNRTCLSQFAFDASANESDEGNLGETLAASGVCPLRGFSHKLWFDATDTRTWLFVEPPAAPANRAIRLSLPLGDSEDECLQEVHCLR